MKIKSLHLTDYPPIHNVEIKELGEIVVIAGANGAGKSRLKDAIIQTFQPDATPQLDIEIEATRSEEKNNYWQSNSLVMTKGSANPTLHTYLRTRTKGGTYTGAVIHIDSQRQINNVQYPQLSLSTTDPDDAEIDYSYYLPPFSAKWNEIVNRLYQKAASRALKIAQYCIDHPGETNNEALKANPDPFVEYQDIFEKLLPGKHLLPIDPKSPGDFIYITESGQSLNFATLSSGEQEVIKVAFYILSKKISHCVFLVDEPELHLHPTLTFRLIETLKEIGRGTNQYIFFTHSADLISTYYTTGNVYFIDSDKSATNQAHKLSDIVDTHSEIAEVMSENLGLFAVGKKILFVEGTEASQDRLTYHAVSQFLKIDVNIISVGTLTKIMKLKNFSKEIENAVFGIQFYMIRDRDGLTEDQILALERNKRIFCLKRRHIENYFLDPKVLSFIAKQLHCESYYFSVENVTQKLKQIAEKYINKCAVLNIQHFIRSQQNFEIPKVRKTVTGEFTSVVDSFTNLLEESLKKQAIEFSKDKFEKLFTNEQAHLTQSLTDGTWIFKFPGKEIFNSFCGDEGIKQDPVKVRELYIDHVLKQNNQAFKDIFEILKQFKTS
jgi:ABC-type cobalamin/Fe3+-siderophores transport system ATPase subunit